MRKKVSIIFLLVFYLAVDPSITRAQSPSTLIIDPAALILEANVGAESATASLKISTGEASINNLLFTPNPLMNADGLLAVPSEAISVIPTQVSQLEANTTLIVIVTINTPPEPGNYTGNLTVQYDNQASATEELIDITLIVNPVGVLDSEGELVETSTGAEESPPDLDLTVALKADGPSADIPIIIRSDATSTSIPLYLRQMRETEFQGVRFFAFLTDEQGEQVTEATFSFAAYGEIIADAGITIPANGRQVLLLMTVGGLERVGVFTGELLVEFDGTIERAAGLTIERFPQPSLKIVGVSDAGGLNLNSATRDFTRTFTIESTNPTNIESLKIEVEPFTSSKSTTIPVSWKVVEQSGENPIVINGLDSVTLEISADLPVEDTYTSAIRLIYAGKRESTSLTVTRQQPLATLSLIELNENVSGETVSKCLFFWPCPWSKTEGVRFLISLEETTGQDVTINLPEVTDLIHIGDKFNRQAWFDQVAITNEDGTPLTLPLMVKGWNTKRLRITIEGLREAGNYDGVLKITIPDTPPIEQNFKLKMQEPAWVAGLWIFFSVVASYFARLWVQSLRPKLDRQQTAIALVSDLEALGTSIPDENRWKGDLSGILSKLRGRLNRLRARADLGTDVNAETVLIEIDLKLSLFPNLVACYQQIAHLEPTSVADGLYLEQLKPIHARMMLETPGSATEAESLLNTMPEKIQEAVVAELRRQFATFRQNVEAEGDKAAQQGRKLAYQTILDEIAGAEMLVVRASPPKEEMQKARKILNEQTLAYVRLISEDLMKRLDEPPIGFTTNDWNQAKDRIDTALQKSIGWADSGDPKKALEAYQAAFTLYLETIAGKLGEEIARAIQRVDANIMKKTETKNGIEKDVQDGSESRNTDLEKINKELTASAQHKDELKELQRNTQAITDHLRKGELIQAQDLYNQARLAYMNLKPQLVSMKVLSAPTATDRSPAEALGASIHAILDLIPQQPIEERLRLLAVQRSVVSLQKKLGDLVVNAIVLYVAVLLGLNILYDATWGGLEDHIGVVLWGFSLQQGGQTAFNGLADFFASHFKETGSNSS